MTRRRTPVRGYDGTVTVTEILTEAISSAGPLAYVYYVLGYVLTALSPVIPTPLVTALGGTALGFWPAVWLGILGLGLGAAVSLSLARLVGRPLIAFLTRKPDLGDWEQLLGVSSLRVWGVLLFALNIDMVVLVSGLTSLPVRRLWLTAVVARTPWVIGVAWFGSSLFESWTALVVGLIAGAAVVVFLTLNAARLRRGLLKWSEQNRAAGRGSNAATETGSEARSQVAQTRVEDVAHGVAQQVEADD